MAIRKDASAAGMERGLIHRLCHRWQKHCCDNGVDEILVYDWSVTDEDHEAAIAVIKESVQEADAPVIAGGRVKRMEDVKEISLCRSQCCIFRHEQKEETQI